MDALDKWCHSEVWTNSSLSSTEGAAPLDVRHDCHVVCHLHYNLRCVRRCGLCHKISGSFKSPTSDGLVLTFDVGKSGCLCGGCGYPACATGNVELDRAVPFFFVLLRTRVPVSPLDQMSP